MAYRDDRDLTFLSEMPSEDLNDLSYCLIHDENGEIRYTEELTTNERFENANPDHHQYWDLIAAELQCFGANTFVTLLRGGEGVLYKEVLCDVCDRMKVNYNKNATITVIEDNLLQKILTDSLNKMTPDELQELARSMGKKNTSGITPEILVGLFQAIFKAGGFKSYQLTVIIANAVMKAIFKHGLKFAANAALNRAMAVLTGPIGWVITGLWTAVDIAGPAYRVTIPAVIQVAVLRKKANCSLGEVNTNELSIL